MKIALLGAESTGKTQLAHALAAHFLARGQTAVAIDEYLREWCDQAARTPRQNEQAYIAQTQQTRIEAASKQSDWVFADTTPLMTAIYSEFIFKDTSLTAPALDYQKSFDLTLITGLDMPWLADGIQRDGEHVRAPVDTLLRKQLQAADIAYEVIYGSGEQRTANALQAIARLSKAQVTTNSVALHAENTTASDQNDLKKWQRYCEKCSDADCEHRLFRSLQ
jgi:nicotinamide riboside kinase